MAVNPTTGIDSSVDRFAVYQVSSSSFVNLNATWPRTDGGPLVGANPDFRYYKKTVSTPPATDHRFTLTTSWSVVDIAAPEGYPAGEYRQSHTIAKLPIADLKAQVETEFEKQFSAAITLPSIQSQLTATMDAVVRKQGGAALTAKQQEKLTAAMQKGSVVARLEARRDALMAAIDADRDYDITEGWE